MSIQIFSATLPTIYNILEEGKEQTFFLKDQIPYVETRLKVNTPTPASILNALPRVTTPDQFRKIQSNFIRLKEECKKTEDELNNLVVQTNKIIGKLRRVEEILSNLDQFISFLSEFIPVLRILITSTQIALAAQVTPLVSGLTTIRLGDAIRFGKSKLKEIDSLTDLVSQVTEPVLEEVEEYKNILLPLNETLNKILAEIRARCFYLDSVLISKLKELELSMTQNPSSDGGVSGPQGTGVPQDTETIVNLLYSQFDPEKILDNLENSNKEKFVEYLVENGFTGYQVVKR